MASPAAAHAECNCAGITAGRSYTVRQLLAATLLVSGNDAAHALADMLGGYDIAVDKMFTEFGIPLSVSDVRERYGRAEPSTDDDIVTAPQQTQTPQDPPP